MTASFTTFEQEYDHIVRRVNKHIEDLSKGPTSTLARVLAEAELDFTELEGYAKAMDTEVKGMGSGDKKRYGDKVSQYRNGMNSLRRNLDNAKAKAEKQLLLQGSKKPGPKGATERLLRSTEQLHDARRVVGETEQIGDGIINQMESQREQLMRASENVEETNFFSRSARQVMNNMHIRAVQHKACMLLIIFILLILIGVVFYYGICRRWLKKN